MPGRKVSLVCGRPVGDRPVHAGRAQDAGPKVVGEGATGHGLDDGRQHEVVGAAVRVRGAGRPERMYVVQLGDALHRSRAVGVDTVGDLEGGRLGHTGGLLEQVADGDARSVTGAAETEVGHVVDDRVVEPEPPVLHEGHHGTRGDRFGDRAPKEGGFDCDRFAVSVRSPGACVDRLVGSDDGVGKPGRTGGLHALVHVGVHGLQAVRGDGRGGRGRRMT